MKGGEHVRIIIDGNPKEIAALVLAVQERQGKDVHSIKKMDFADALSRAFWATFAPSASYGKGEEALCTQMQKPE